MRRVRARRPDDPLPVEQVERAEDPDRRPLERGRQVRRGDRNPGPREERDDGAVFLVEPFEVAGGEARGRRVEGVERARVGDRRVAAPREAPLAGEADQEPRRGRRVAGRPFDDPFGERLGRDQGREGSAEPVGERAGVERRELVDDVVAVVVAVPPRPPTGEREERLVPVPGDHDPEPDAASRRAIEPVA